MTPSPDARRTQDSVSGSSQKAPRRYGFACLNCRRKKIKCGGEKPICSNCSGDLRHSCHYGNQRTAEIQLRLAQQQIRALQHEIDAISSQKRTSRNSLAGPTPSPGTIPASQDGEDKEESSHERISPEELKRFWSHVSLDEKGSPNYHGSTSRFHLDVDKSDNNRLVSECGEPSEATKNKDLQVLRSNSELLKMVWEPLAYARLDGHGLVSPDMGSKLLKIYWTWQHPLHNCVYRPCFFRDMAIGGPYYSEFLLMSIYALAARHVDENDPRFLDIGRGEKFLERARVLLLAELSQSKPRIPTIQGLLVLGGRQCAIGNSSEGWLYTGMAIRMLKDVGLHLNSHRLKGLESLTPADLEARKRLFFSAYIWDKSISLCLGRPPSLTEMPYAIDDMLDNFDDLDPWEPVFIGGMQQYPDTKEYNTSTFKEFCRVGEIITQIYSSVYNNQKAQCLSNDLMDLETRLCSWYYHLPHILRMDDVGKIKFCPPPHIFSLNLVYHTLLILIYRPFLHSTQSPQLQAHAQTVCSAQSIIINDLFLLYGRTYNYNIMTYLVSYCIYTAATINVHDIKHSDSVLSHEVAARLSVSLRVLESEARQTPGIRRSIDIIKSQLSTWDRTDKPEPQRGWGETQDGVDYDSNNSYSILQDIETSGLRAGDVYAGIVGPSYTVQQDTNALDMSMFNAGFLDPGGGFQPNAFHWTIDDTWDIAM
ncbi:hypothetical protein VF21_10138 [Pseudogymnoascus sp. 05NY08]|nr:hypothetical protein VF21_10138 [Pseudogymnoascus sp. 05NY08]